MASEQPDYHCPMCGTLSTMIISAAQAFCTNTESCNVISFNPSLPDGGMSDVHFVDFDLGASEKMEIQDNGMHIDSLTAMKPEKLIDYILETPNDFDFWLACGILAAKLMHRDYAASMEQVYATSFRDDPGRRSTAEGILRGLRERLAKDVLPRRFAND